MRKKIHTRCTRYNWLNGMVSYTTSVSMIFSTTSTVRKWGMPVNGHGTSSVRVVIFSSSTFSVSRTINAPGLDLIEIRGNNILCKCIQTQFDNWRVSSGVECGKNERKQQKKSNLYKNMRLLPHRLIADQLFTFNIPLKIDASNTSILFTLSIIYKFIHRFGTAFITDVDLFGYSSMDRTNENKTTK